MSGVSGTSLTVLSPAREPQPADATPPSAKTNRLDTIAAPVLPRSACRISGSCESPAALSRHGSTLGPGELVELQSHQGCNAEQRGLLPCRQPAPISRGLDPVAAESATDYRINRCPS